MTRTTNKITRSLAPALVMAALIAPTAGAYQDISSQDMRDVAEPSAPASGRHDLRSQDALDAARSLPPDQLAAVAEGLHSGADESEVRAPLVGIETPALPSMEGAERPGGSPGVRRRFRGCCTGAASPDWWA
jgi:hypothetical protein